MTLEVDIDNYDLVQVLSFLMRLKWTLHDQEGKFHWVNPELFGISIDNPYRTVKRLLHLIQMFLMAAF